ncbi:MAG: 16S rRNA (adenine(1518)-N(6)/adenine(1519)-N(6))-dimethyltransferase RsmA [Patescibacteria group bacterium]
MASNGVRRKGARLGQHFLNAEWVARDLVGAVAPREGEVIAEVGPGRGALTEKLLATGNTVVAIEKDEALGAFLAGKFADETKNGKLHLMLGDIRNGDTYDVLNGRPYVVAANIPYYITGEIIRDFLTAKHQPRAMALLIQKEVAERIVARDGKESILSLSVKAYGTPKIVAKVPAGCFNPPPSVDSAIVLVGNISRKFFDEISEDLFFKAVKAGFAAKRKQLAGNLEKVFGEKGEGALRAAGVDAKVRAEDLNLDDWKRIVGNLV